MTEDQTKTYGFAVLATLTFLSLGIGGLCGWPYGCLFLGVTFLSGAIGMRMRWK